MKSRILIVEDSPTQTALLTAVLESENYQVDAAADASIALEKLKQVDFNMVITDIQMPGMSGYELCRTIKNHESWRSIPVILLTSRKDPRNIIMGLECGADSFFTKPFEPKHLTERVQQLFFNRNLRAQGKLKVGIEISLFGKVININNEKEQILDLLITTFEDIIKTNNDLDLSRKELAAANHKIEEYVAILEQRVHTSEERYRKMFENMAEGIFILDEFGAIETENPSARKLFGYSEEELQLKSIRELLPSVGINTKQWLQDHVGKEPIEMEGFKKNKEEVCTSISISEIISAGHHIYIGVLTDLTNERRYEQRLRQAEKMETVGQLSGGIAHDFNNQLTVILGNIDELLPELADQPQLAAIAKMIHRSATQGAQLVKRLLAFARSQPLAPSVVDVNQMMEGIEALLRPILGKGITVKLERGKNVWLTKADPSELENGILNLCINARDAMPQGGTITIVTENKILDEDYAEQHAEVEPGEYVQISISDNGTGIPAELQHKIFEPFFTTKPSGKGTGMGLAMVYGFVKQSKGHLRLYSEPGEGTTVTVYLPHTAEQINAEEEKTVSATAQANARILVVDDNEMIRELAQRQLESLGYKVVSAENGPEAIELVRNGEEFDLLFSDVFINDSMNGPQLAGVIHQLKPGLRVLYTSGFTEQSLIEKGQVRPGVNLLNKPFTRSELQEKVSQVLQA